MFLTSRYPQPSRLNFTDLLMTRPMRRLGAVTTPRTLSTLVKNWVKPERVSNFGQDFGVMRLPHINPNRAQYPYPKQHHLAQVILPQQSCIGCSAVGEKPENWRRECRMDGGKFGVIFVPDRAAMLGGTEEAPGTADHWTSGMDRALGFTTTIMEKHGTRDSSSHGGVLILGHDRVLSLLHDLIIFVSRESPHQLRDSFGFETADPRDLLVTAPPTASTSHPWLLTFVEPFKRADAEVHSSMGGHKPGNRIWLKFVQPDLEVPDDVDELPLFESLTTDCLTVEYEKEFLGKLKPIALSYTGRRWRELYSRGSCLGHWEPPQ